MKNCIFLNFLFFLLIATSISSYSQDDVTYITSILDNKEAEACLKSVQRSNDAVAYHECLSKLLKKSNFALEKNINQKFEKL